MAKENIEKSYNFGAFEFNREVKRTTQQARNLMKGYENLFHGYLY